MQRRFTFAALAGIIALATAATASAQIDSFLCYKSKPTKGAPKFQRQTDLALASRFDDVQADAVVPRQLCLPADVGGAGIVDAQAHLRSYKTVISKTDPAQAKHVKQSGLRVTNALGEVTLDTKKALLLMLPASLCVDSPAGTCPDPVPPLDPLAHSAERFACYSVGLSRGASFAPGQQLSVGDAFTPAKTFDVKVPKQLCVPVDKDLAGIQQPTAALLCYKVKPAAGQPVHTHVGAIESGDEFGEGHSETVKEQTLCLPSTIDSGKCNGAAELCGRRYDQVSYATTHNAMSNADGGFAFPNQHHGISQQLREGIRGLMLDTHYDDGGVPSLCHGACFAGKESLVDGLGEIKRFLDHRPDEVVSIIFEAYVTAIDTQTAFAAAGLLDYAHVQTVGQPWPTLTQLVASGKRLVVFSDAEPNVLPWYLYVWDYAWETHYSFQQPSDLSCDINRGAMANSLFILNHFLTQTFGSENLASQVNFNPLFLARAQQCESESGGRLPNFVTVDFYDIGDVFDVVRVMNGL